MTAAVVPARARPAVRALRRLLRRALSIVSTAAGPAGIALGLYLLGSGRLRPLLAPGAADADRLGAALALLLLTGVLGLKMVERLRPGPRAAPVAEPSVRTPGLRGLPSRARAGVALAELESGTALVLCTFFMLQVLGGARSPLHPLVYALAAFLCSLHALPVALPLLALIFLCEALLLQGDGLLRRQPERLLVHGLFVALFATLHSLFLKGQLLLLRRDHHLRVGGEIHRMREEASLYRLLDREAPRGAAVMNREAPRGAAVRPATGSRAEAEVVLAQGSVVVIQKSLAGLLGLLQRALHLHACALYFLAPDRDELILKEASAESPKERGRLRAQVPADAGALGMVVKRRAALNLPAPKEGHLAYYAPPPPPLAGFVGVPILAGQGEALWAVLAADRAGSAIGAEEEALLLGAADQVQRLLQSERAFTAVERGRYEHEQLYHASERLNRALTPEQVYETAFAAAREVAGFDFAALTSYDRALRRHTVVAVEGEAAVLRAPPAGGLLLRTFPDNAGLCAMAVKNRAALPVGEAAPREPVVFDDETRLCGIGALLVLPLQCAGEPVGTLVFAALRDGSLGKDQREMLGVIGNQVAVSLENARMYQAMEAMATTDGLTGLTNRRAFNDRFEEMLRRAQRQGKCLTILMSDIDHFKRVNDTYGHPVGDLVLKRVAQVVQSCLRKIDIAARYGGEEFALVLELTDREGARQLAERVRVEVSRLSFPSDKGPFQCTLSLGMATFPQDGGDEATLIAHADLALYQAKHGGRNRAVAFAEL